MRNVRLAQLSDNTVIEAIGSLFRKIGSPKWGINVGLSPNQGKHSLTISNAPVLVRKRIINRTSEFQSTLMEDNLHFRIEGTQAWRTQTIHQCPAIQFVKYNNCELKQRCFTFELDSGMTIYLPQFELARALFLHDAYMSRTAMESECLKAEFDIIINKVINEARINVLPSSGYSLRSFDDPGARRVLSWVLIDPDARSSFESIGRYQKMYATEHNGYRHWDFQFDPPPLYSVKFEVRGVLDRASNTMFVHEIVSLRNISVDVPEVVAIYHPEFRESGQGDGDGGEGTDSGTSLDYNVFDDVEASFDREHILLGAPMLIFEFANSFKTVKTADKKQGSRADNGDYEAPDAAVIDSSAAAAVVDSSTDEPTASGELPCADWDIVEDETDDTAIYANKFECFRKMLELLVDEFKCTIITKQIRKLPRVPRCKKHLLTIGNNPRCIMVVEITLHETSFHILEVDTSDSANSLSTQLLLLNSPYSWKYQLEELERELVQCSLHWPSQLLDQFCEADRRKGVPHPKSTSKDKGLLESASIAHWADRVYGWMQAML